MGEAKREKSEKAKVEQEERHTLRRGTRIREQLPTSASERHDWSNFSNKSRYNLSHCQLSLKLIKD